MTTLEIDGEVLKELKENSKGAIEPKLQTLQRKESVKKFIKNINKKLSKSSKTKLKNRKILRKGKRPTVVVQVAHKPRREIKNMMAESVQEDGRNFFFQ